MKKSFLIGLFAAVACSGDPPLPPDDAGVVDIGPGRFDRDNDGILDRDDNCPDTINPDQNNDDGDVWGDVCDRCPTINQSQCISVNEVEPNDLDGQMITLAGNDEWLEVLGELSPQDPRDRYLLTVTTEVRLQTRVVRRLDSNFEPLLVASGGTYTVEREVDGERVAERWLYFFGPGTYQLEVRDRRGAPTEKVGYALHLIRDQWVDTTLALIPIPPERLNPDIYDPDPPSATFDVSDGKVFGIRMMSDDDYNVELRAETSSGSIDTILVNRFSGQEFDNFEQSSDARLLLLEGPRSDLFIVDHRRKTSPTAQVKVTARYFWLPENEPNNSRETATPVLPQSRMMGWITEPNPAPDFDWLRFESDPNKAYLVRTTVTGADYFRGQQMVEPPEIEWNVTVDGDNLHRCRFPPAGPPSQTFQQQVLVAPRADHFFVQVGDHRNQAQPYRGWTPWDVPMVGTLSHYSVTTSNYEFTLLAPTISLTESATLTFTFEQRGTYLIQIAPQKRVRLDDRLINHVNVIAGFDVWNGPNCTSSSGLPQVLESSDATYYLSVEGAPAGISKERPEITFYFSLTPE